MTEYWSGSITFTGLGSGTDFDSIIEAEMEVESYRLTQLEEWEEQWTSKLELIEDLSTALATYESALESMNSIGSFLSKEATSTNEEVVGVSATDEAVEGHNTIEVGQVAQNSIVTSSTSWSSEEDSVTDYDGVMGFYYGNDYYEIDVDAGTSLEELVSLINNDAELGQCITASIIDTGDDYVLQLSGADMGEDYAISVVNVGLGDEEVLSQLGADDFSTSQEAQNALIKVNGYPEGEDEWISRESNTIDDVIDGLTLTLYQDSAGETIEITTVNDSDAMYENIEAFVEATNEVLAALAAFDDYDDVSTTTTTEDDDVTTTFTSVHGNYGVTTIDSMLSSILSSKALGFSYYDSDTGLGDLYTALSTIGISTETDEDSEDFGLLVIDEDELSEAIEEDPDAVANLFATENEGESHDTTCTYESSIEDLTEAGDYEISYTVENGELVSAYINGNEAEIDGWTITGVYGNSEAGLVVSVNDKSDGTHTSDVSIRQGLINTLLDTLDTITDSESGILTIIEDNYQEIIDNNADDIEAEEARLDAKEERLIEKYATLEATLGEYDDLSETLESLIDDLE